MFELNIPAVDAEYMAVQIEGLERRIAALPERQMRQTAIAELFGALRAEELVYGLHLISQRAASGSSRARDVMQELALESTALSQLPYAVLQDAYNVACEHELSSIQRLLFAEPMRPADDIDEAFTSNEHYELPLGIRRQAARGRDRNVIDRLLHDRNWRVIELLLNNPLLTERDVIAIAARRPTRPEILAIVASHPKWSSRYRVRKALVCNPYTPHALGKQLISTLMAQDLKSLSRDGVIPYALRENAVELRHNQHRITGRTVHQIETPEESLAELLAAAEALVGGRESEVEEMQLVDTLESGDPVGAELLDLVAAATVDLQNAVLVPVGEEERAPDSAEDSVWDLSAMMSEHYSSPTNESGSTEEELSVDELLSLVSEAAFSLENAVLVPVGEETDSDSQ